MKQANIEIDDHLGIRLMTPAEAVEYVKNQLSAAGQWFAEISRNSNSYLSLVKYSLRSIIVIYIEKQPYRALDASESPAFSHRRRTLIFEGSETIVPANIVIGKGAALRAVSRYVMDGELESTLYWLPDGQG